MYLLDTNIISELRKPRPHGGLLTWFQTVASPQIAISAMTIGELQRGIERTRKQDTRKALELETWIDGLLERYSILPLDGLICREWARLLEGKSEDLLEDAMIAATARIHRLTVATRNLADFALLDVSVVNPFDTPRNGRKVEERSAN